MNKVMYTYVIYYLLGRKYGCLGLVIDYKLKEGHTICFSPKIENLQIEAITITLDTYSPGQTKKKKHVGMIGVITILLT